MSLVKKFASVGGATMASRVLGFARDALIGAALGAGPVADAFYAAFQLPNLFRRLFAEGAFNSAFVPKFANAIETGGVEKARTFAEQVLSVLITVLLLLSALAMIFMTPIIGVMFDEFAKTPNKIELTVELTRIMFPYLFCMSLVAMFSGILNSMRHYFVAAIVPVVLNIILVAVTAYALQYGYDEFATGRLLGWGVFVSGIAQLLFLIVATRRAGFSFSLRLPKLTPEVKHLMILMGPAMLTGGVVQINIMIGRIIAARQDGAIALLNYADRINQLPLGVIGIAIGVVLLPELARALKGERMEEAKHLQNRSLEFALALTLPATIALMVMPAPIVNILYERGAFTAETTLLTASALAAFATGLPAYVLIKVLQPAFFAREDMKTPMWYSMVTVVVNVVLSFVLFPLYGHVAIAAATSISAWVNCVLLGWALWNRGHFVLADGSRRKILMIILSSVLMGIALYTMTIGASSWIASASTLTRVVSTLAVLAIGTAVFAIAVLATGGLDMRELRAALKRKSKTEEPVNLDAS
ncbi:MAG: murein biosynthesis integral membrane protein MurJ [Rhizobiaceae bacterium]